MYLWNVDKLVEEFRNGTISEKEKFKYYLLFTVLFTLTTGPIFNEGFTKPSPADLLVFVMTFAIPILGIFHLFKINTAGDNQNFIERVTCIGLPVGVRLTVLWLIPLSIVIAIFEKLASVTLTSPLGDPHATMFDVAFVSFATLYYYYYLGKKIADVSK